MKKLMIAALAAAAVGGAFAAANCERTPDTTTPKDVALVYTWKFSGKTTTGAYVKIADNSVTTGGGCKRATTVYDTCPDYCIIRVPSSLKIQGYTYLCADTCTDACFESLADVEAFYATKPVKEYFKITSGTKRDDILTEGLTIDFAYVIGTKAKDFELKGTFNAPTANTLVNYNFTFAGLGKYDLKNTRISSVSGNFAGVAQKPVVYAAKLSKKQLENLGITSSDCVAATVWLCDGSCVDVIPDESVAYGSWSMKYNKSASAKYLKGYQVTLPKGLLN